MRQILFDLDGTLIDSRAGIMASIRYALGKLNRPIPSPTALENWIGPPLTASFAQQLELPENAPLVVEALRLYRVNYNAGGMLDVVVYPGINDLLHGLQAGDQQLYVATGKPQVYAQKIIEHLGWTQFFKGVYGPQLDGTHGNKADLLTYLFTQEGGKSERAIMIGDRSYDMLAAQAHGIIGLGVLWGFGSAEELQNSGAQQLISRVIDLTNILSGG